MRVNSSSRCSAVVNAVVAVGIFSIVNLSAASVYRAQSRVPAGLDNEGCVGSKQDEAVVELHERLPNHITPVMVPVCGPDQGRCDGGFAWQPYMINRERGWIFYSLPKKGNWVGVTVRNICTHRRVMRAEFLNEEDSPYISNESAFASGWALDKKQKHLQGFDNIALRMFRLEGEYRVEVYGWNDDKSFAILLDSFPLSPI